MASLLERFRTHVRAARLFPRPGTAVVAVSGGPDSIALLDLMQGVAAELGLALVVAHADHQIRADSGVVAAAVRQVAATHGLPFELGELELGPATSETAARAARQAWLRAVRRRRAARYVVLGHTRDDQVETILMRVLRGSAPAGLAAMAARARGGLVRPLLSFTKADVAAHAAHCRLPTHDDPANHDPRHLRSWVRTALLPLLESRLGPGLRDDVLRVGDAAALERRAWDGILEHLPELRLRRVADGFDVAREAVRRYDDAVAVAVLRAAARRAGLVLGIRAARAVVALAGRPSGRHLALGGGWTAEVAFDELRIRRGVADPTTAFVAMGERGDALFGGFRMTWAPASAPAALARHEWTTWIPGGEWEVRPPRRGDRLVPVGGVGHRPLRRLLMEARVPRSDRANYPVVTRGPTILWVPGVCRSADDLPEPGTPAVRLDVTKRSESQADGRA
jgi:tRNA(Ile)-lysidine synthase